MSYAHEFDDTGVHRRLNDLYSALDAKCWTAALALAFTLPDACIRLENPDHRQGGHYKAWVERYLLPLIRRPTMEGDPMSASDIYALRCSYLHSSNLESGDEKTGHKRLDRFMFVAGGNLVDGNLIDNALQLDAEKFCEDIARAVLAWYEANMSADVVERSKLIARVHDSAADLTWRDWNPRGG